MNTGKKVINLEGKNRKEINNQLGRVSKEINNVFNNHKEKDKK